MTSAQKFRPRSTRAEEREPQAAAVVVEAAVVALLRVEGAAVARGPVQEPSCGSRQVRSPNSALQP